MFTSGPAFGEAIGTFEGEPLYHGSLDPAEYRALLDAQGFEVVAHVAEDATCGGHTIWLARRRIAHRRNSRRELIRRPESASSEVRVTLGAALSSRSGRDDNPPYFSGECTAGSMTVECISSSMPALLFRNACQPGSLPLPPRAAARALRSG